VEAPAGAGLSTEWSFRVDLALAYRVCARFGFNEGVCNHLSFKLPGQDRFLLIDYGVHWSRARASDIQVVDFEGDVLVGSGCPERTGFFSHRAMHKALGNDAAAIFHTHQPFATALTALRPECGGRLLPLQQGILKFCGHVAYDEAWGGLFDADTSDQTTAVAERFVRDHGKCPRAMLCANHGVFTFGSSIAEAWDNLYYLERLCEVQVRALSCAGGDMSKLQLISDQAVQAELSSPATAQNRVGEIAAHWRGMQGLLQQDPAEYKCCSEQRQ